MGLFHDKCPNCGESVSKKARFCSKCGHGAPQGWVKCPSCRTWVGNDSRFCPHCNHPLHPEERIDIAGGVWDRRPGVFAQRIELTDVTGIEKSGLKIQEGTLAILLDAGKKSAILGPGRHSPEGTLRNVNWFGNPPPRSVVMVDSGDCVFRMDFKGMRTAEELSVDVVCEVTLRFDPGEANGFLANMMKGEARLYAAGGDAKAENSQDSERIYAKDVSTWLVSEATAAVKDLCLQSTVEDLVKDPERRPRFEDAIGRALKDLLKRSGLELVRVGYVDFISPAYEKMREQYGDLDAKRRQLEFDRKLHDYVLESDRARQEFNQTRLSQDVEGDLKTLVIEADGDRRRLDLDEQKNREGGRRRQDTEEYFAQLAQEKGLAAESRRAELEIARKSADGQIDAKSAEEQLAKLRRDHEIEFAELEHRFEEERRTRAHELSEKLETARGQNAVKDELRRDEQRDAVHRAGLGDIGRSEKVKDAQSDATVDRTKIDTETYGAKAAQDLAQSGQENALKNLERMAELEAKERRDLANTVKGLRLEEMAALEEDPEQRARLMELARLEREQALEKARLEAAQRMTADQILAHQAGGSQSAADAFAAKVKAEAEAASAKAVAEVAQHDKLLDEMKQMMGDRVAHDDKLIAMIHDIAAKAVEKPVTVINTPPAAPAQPATMNIVK